MTIVRRERDHLRLVAEPASVAGRVPPHDLDAEAAVISACLLDAAALVAIVDLLKPWDFYSDDNGEIYRTICAVRASGAAVDVITVASELRAREKLARVGGAAYLARLVDATPAVAHVRHHAMILAELGQRRRAIGTLQRLAAESYGDVGPHAEWIQSVEQTIAEVCARLTAGEHMHDLSESLAWALGVLRAREETGAPAGELLGISTGLRVLDGFTGGLHDGDVTLLGGRKGGGKSALAQYLALACADAGERRSGVLIVSMEMPHVQLAQRIACAAARVDWLRIKTGRYGPHELTALYGAAEYLRDLPIKIDAEPAITIAKLRAKIARAQAELLTRKKARLRLVLIDYVQLMHAEGVEHGANRERQISWLGEQIKQIAQELQLPILLLTQLNQAGVARESEALEMHADNVWGIEIDDLPDARFPGDARPATARVRIGKQRSGPRNVVAPLYWYPQYTTFADEEDQAPAFAPGTLQ